MIEKTKNEQGTGGDTAKRGLAMLLAPLAVGVLIGFVLGIWVGSSNLDFGSVPVTQLPPHASQPQMPASAATSHPAPKAVEPPRAEDQVATAVTPAKPSEPPSDLDSIGELFNWNATEKMTSLVINALSDEKLVSALVSLTTITEEQLEDIDDLQAYTNRLAEIAMSGLLTDPIEPKEGIGPVQFATYADTDEGAHNPQTRFSSQEEKIYAVFTTEDYRESRVFLHWFRVSNPKLLLLEQYRINHRDRFSYVWLEERKGWEAGEYRVEVYADTEDLSPLAYGSFMVVEGDY